MYPSEKDKLFGVFVRNSKVELEKQGVLFAKEAIIRGKTRGVLKKSFIYLWHYLRAGALAVTGKYDLTYVHFLSHHMPLLLFLFILKRGPLAVNMHGSDILWLLKFPLVKRLSIYLMNRLDLLIVPTAFYKELLTREFPGLKTGHIYISPSGGIDRSLFRPLDMESGNEKGVRLGFISRLTERKGWKVYLEALRLLQEQNIVFQGIMAGKGEDKEVILEEIEKLKLKTHIEFLDFVPQNKLPQVYNRMDLYVFPTLIETESLGLTGLESMACGVPVVASRLAGPATYTVEGHNGYLFAPGDAHALMEKIRLFHGLDTSKKSEMKKNALLTAQEYDKRNVALHLQEKLAEVLEQYYK